MSRTMTQTLRALGYAHRRPPSREKGTAGHEREVLDGPPLAIRLALVWRGASHAIARFSPSAAPRLPGYVIGIDHGGPKPPVLVVPREAIEAHGSDTWMGFRLIPSLPAALRRTRCGTPDLLHLVRKATGVVMHCEQSR